MSTLKLSIEKILEDLEKCLSELNKLIYNNSNFSEKLQAIIQENLIKPGSSFFNRLENDLKVNKENVFSNHPLSACF